MIPSKTLLIIAAFPLLAQGKHSGTYINSDEIQAYLKRAPAETVSDQQVRAVDIGKSHVDE